MGTFVSVTATWTSNIIRLRDTTKSNNIQSILVHRLCNKCNSNRNSCSDLVSMYYINDTWWCSEYYWLYLNKTWYFSYFSDLHSALHTSGICLNNMSLFVRKICIKTENQFFQCFVNNIKNNCVFILIRFGFTVLYWHAQALYQTFST